MDFELIIGLVVILAILFGVIFLIIKGFQIILTLLGIVSILGGFVVMFQSILGLPLGVSLIFSGGLMLAVADLMDKSKEHQKKIDSLITQVQALQQKNEQNTVD